MGVNEEEIDRKEAEFLGLKKRVEEDMFKSPNQ